MEDGSEWTQKEKDRGRCSNENMEDGSGWTPKERDRGRCSNGNMEVSGHRKRETEEDVVMRTWKWVDTER